MPIREITVEALSETMRTGHPPRLLDVRSEGEHAIAAIDGAMLIPLPELSTRLAELDEAAWSKGDAIVVLCHHGVRSRSGAAIVAQAGFSDVCSLAGGIDAWSLRVDPRIARY